MSSKYSTIQQHEPLRVPEGWGAKEKRFVAQLEEILDDLYRRFGRLKMSDLGSALQKRIIEAEDEIQLRVTSAEYEAGMAEKLDADDPSVGVSNSAIVINTDGIAMTGGSIVMSATSQLDMRSGGVVIINGASGTINLGTGSQINAEQASFGSLVIGGEVYRKIVYSDTQPSGHDIFWARPQSSVLSSVTATYPTPSAVNQGNPNWDFVNGSYGVQNNPHIHSFSDAQTLSGSTFRYVFEYPFTAWRDLSGMIFHTTITRGGRSITFDNRSLSIQAYSTLITYQYVEDSNVNLFASDVISYPIVVTSWCENIPYLFYTQANQLVKLTASVVGSAATAQCDLFYIQ